MRRGPAVTRVVAALLAALTALTATSAGAETIAAPGTLSDAAFHRLVGCAAPPDGACSTEPIRWDRGQRIRVALRQIAPGYLGRKRPRADAALTRAVDELNAAGANLRLSRVPATAPAEIVVHFLDLAEGAAISGTGLDWVDGTQIDRIATLIAVAPDTPRIHRAAIVVASTLETRDYEAEVLKALTRAMGLTTEVSGAAYAGLSVLAPAPEDGAAPTRLAPQDIAALRLHYANAD